MTGIMLGATELEQLIARHLAVLVQEIGCRPVGSEANQRAARYIATTLARAGYHVEERSFPCVDWQLRHTRLTLDGISLEARANTYSPGCDLTAPWLAASTLDELEAQDLRGRIAVLHGELTSEPLFPKNFPFFQVESHQRIVAALEHSGAAAAVLVSHRAGDVMPLIEDGDLDLPTVTISSLDGERLLARRGVPLTLSIEASRHPSSGATVVARTRKNRPQRIILCAHLDTKHDTPGALDNGAGVAALLALAHVLAGWNGEVALEFVAFNGEECYNAPGQVAYLAAMEDPVDSIALVINLDGVGWAESWNSVALFGLAAEEVKEVLQTMAHYPDIIEDEPWPQGDHSIFTMQGIPALAFSSENIGGLIDHVIHTPADTLDGVSPARIASAVRFIKELLREERIWQRLELRMIEG